MISAQPQAERPRERCLRVGAQNLSLRECLALLIGSGPPGKGCLGLAADILQLAGADSEVEQEEIFFRGLESIAAAQLLPLKGLGVAGRARLLAAFELARRYSNLQLR